MKKIKGYLVFIFVFLLTIMNGKVKAEEIPPVCLEGFDERDIIVMDRNDVKIYSAGINRTVVVGNVVKYGFICLVERVDTNIMRLDRKSGLDVVGLIDESEMLGKNGEFLMTAQFFRGGSNYERNYYVVYEIKKDKITEALQIPKEKKLIIGDYIFAETNNLVYETNRFEVEQKLSIKRDGLPESLYGSTRRFDLVYSDEYDNFIEGTAICTNDIFIKKKKVFRKGDHVGYLFEAGLADASGLGLWLINTKGKKYLLDELDDIKFLKILSHK